MSKRALIYGIGGMDGSYLAEHLLNEGYQVWGTSRRSSVNNLERILPIKDRITAVFHCELTDALSVAHPISACDPDEVYNMADQDNVTWSYGTARNSVDVTAGGVANILQAVASIKKEAKVFIPISATIFGNSASPQCEESSHNPLSPYACAKAHAYHLARYYRQVYGMHVVTAILYNHDSPRRGPEYLLQQIYRQCIAIRRNNGFGKVKIGSYEQHVDIGYAREYVEGMHKLMQLPEATDTILATGEGIQIKDIVAHYLRETGYDTTNRIELAERSHYPGPQCELLGDTTKAQRLIGWNPKYDALNMYKILSGEEK